MLVLKMYPLQETGERHINSFFRHCVSNENSIESQITSILTVGGFGTAHYQAELEHWHEERH
jgi:hypothetical protein